MFVTTTMMMMMMIYTHNHQPCNHTGWSQKSCSLSTNCDYLSLSHLSLKLYVNLSSGGIFM